MIVELLLFITTASCLVTEHPFIDLDKKLHNEMIGPEEEAENTFKMFLKYYIEMYDMYRSLRSGNDSYLEMVNDLKKQGGPLMTTAFVDGKKLHYDELHTTLLKEFLDIIDQFWSMVVKKASGVEVLLKE